MLAKRQIFVCYRHSDVGAHAGRLYDALSKDFGEDNVFLDRGGIDGGDDWQQVIDDRLESCTALMALIGSHWQPTRLTDPGDPVCREISRALAGRARVIPILVNDAAKPTAADLPEEIRPLLGKQMMELTDRHWRADYEQLAQLIRKETRRRRKERLSKLFSWGSTLAAIALVLAFLTLMVANKWKSNDQPVATRTLSTTTTTGAPSAPLALKSAGQPVVMGVNHGRSNRVDWSNPALSDVRFVFVSTDVPTFPRLWDEVRHRRLIRCAFHSFNRSDPIEQAEQFVRTAELSQEDLVGVTTWEISPGNKTNLPMSLRVAADLHRYLDRIEELTGKHPFIYANDSWNANFDDSFGSYPLWMKRSPDVVLPRGWTRATLLMERQQLPGLGDMYMLTFNGTMEELKALATKPKT